MIGVNSAIFSPTGGSVGIGFAIPSNAVKTVVAQLRSSGAVERGWLGVTIQNVTPDIADGDRHRERPARRAGRRTWSRTARRSASSRPATSSSPSTASGSSSSRELPKLVAAATPDSNVQIDVLRQGQDEKIDFRLGRFDAEKVASNEPSDTHKGADSERLGATLAPMSPTTREQLGLDDDTDGVVITSLDNSGRAADAGLEVGDVILRVGDTDVRSPRTSTMRCMR